LVEEEERRRLRSAQKYQQNNDLRLLNVLLKDIST